jgi:hypothetical protein
MTASPRSTPCWPPGVPVHVLSGGEVAEASAPGLGDEELEQVTLGGGGRWVLLEPRPGPLGDSLVQVTAALVAEGDAAPAILDLAARGLVHLLGSDAHHAGSGRPVELGAALARLGEVPMLGPHLRWIAETAPAAIVGGEDVSPPFAARP